MKMLCLATTLLITGLQPAHSECEPNISPKDSIGDVKKKLACFAAENNRLKQELANIQRQTQVGQLRIHSVRVHFERDELPANICKARAIERTTTRRGTVVEKGKNWVDLQIGSIAVMVGCNPGEGYVIAAGVGHDEIQSVAQSLAWDIFPKRK